MIAIQNLLFDTSQQKILAFLAENAGNAYLEKEITAKTGVKKSAVNLALHELVREKILAKKQIGRSALFSADRKNNIIKEIKILQNILEIEPLINMLKKESLKIILFGSRADGTNRKKSDIDLFVMTNHKKRVSRMIDKSGLAEKIQLIAYTPAQMVIINKKKPLLFQEIEKGRILWDKHEDEGI